MWTNWNKQKSPKHVVILGDFGDYQEKLIWTGKKLWSEETQSYINETPLKWKVYQH